MSNSREEYKKKMYDKKAAYTVGNKMNKDNLPHSKAMQKKKKQSKEIFNSLLKHTQKKAGGGSVKTKGYSAGGKMKTKGYSAGGKMKTKGYKAGGKMKTKGYKAGGKMKKGYRLGGKMMSKGGVVGGKVRIF